MKHLVNTLAALAIAALLSTSYLLDGPEPTSAATADAIKTGAIQARYTKATGHICGNGAVVEQPDGSIRCALHHGKRTSPATTRNADVVQTASVQP